MRKSLLALPGVTLTLLVGMAGQASAANPHSTDNPTGQPSQSCQDLGAARPGQSGSSPGSPFNEPGVNSTDGGTGGANYSESSQYDVACFQATQH